MKKTFHSGMMVQPGRKVRAVIMIGAAEMKDLLVIDFEMCEVDRNVIKNTGVYLEHEIIQIGAVILNEKNKVTDHYSAYVKPHYGRITPIITELTGIIDMDVERAPELAEALKKFTNWVGDRDVTAASWSDTDQIQVSLEMEQKHIKNNRMMELIGGWVDLQKSYDDLIGVHWSTALGKALRNEKIETVGREHDGEVDAWNTALLIGELRKAGRELVIEPIEQSIEYHDEEPAESAFGNIFAQWKQ